MLQRGLIKLRRKGPTQTGSLGTVKVVSDGASPNIEAFGNLTGREALFIMET